MLANNDRNNMRGVFLETAARAEENIRRCDERQGPFMAEIVPDCSPHWHVVVTLPGHENIVAGHLIGRRFGIYLPESEDGEIRRGRSVTVLRRMLPGYVFVFVWDIDRHLRRIRACPGVIDLLFEDRQVAIVSDQLVNVIRAVENSMRSLRMMTEVYERKRRKGRGRKVMKAIAVDPSEIIGVHSYSPFIEALRQPDVDERLSAFHKAMRLAG